MKYLGILIFVLCGGLLAAASPAPRPESMGFSFPTDLEYKFLPKQKMEFINGVVKNKDANALPDIDAKYSHKVKVDKLIFTLPGELCETMSACYKADLNGDKTADYIFVSVKVWNGRFAGASDVGFFVSTREKKYNFTAFEAQALEAEVVAGRIMPVKFSFSDDGITYIRQFYTFNADGEMRLYFADRFLFKY